MRIRSQVKNINLCVKGLICNVPVTSWYLSYMGTVVGVLGINVQFGSVVPVGVGITILHST